MSRRTPLIAPGRAGVPPGIPTLVRWLFRQSVALDGGWSVSGDAMSWSSVDRRRGVQTFQKILTYLPSCHLSTYFHISTSSLHNLYNPFQYLTFLPSHFHFLAFKNHHYPGILSYWQSFSITLNIVPPGLSSLQSIGTRVMVRRQYAPLPGISMWCDSVLWPLVAIINKHL